MSGSASWMLLVSDRPTWSAALEISLETAGFASLVAPPTPAEFHPEGTRPEAILVDTDTFYRAGEDDPLGAVLALGDSLRAAFPAVPMIFLTALPRAGLPEQGVRWGAARVQLDPLTSPEQRMAMLREAIARCVDTPAPASVPAPERARLATVELIVGVSTMQCDVTVGSELHSIGPREWPSRVDLKDVDEEFSDYESGVEDGQRVTPRAINRAGRRILRALSAYLDDADAFCRERLGHGADILYRFILADGDLEFVPFELVSTANAGEYLRDVHPIARKLVPRQQHGDPDRGPAKDRGRRRVLFIVSDVDGLLQVTGRRFKGKDIASLRSLAHLQAELDQARTLYGADEFEQVVLTPDQDNIDVISRALDGHTFDIVHFAGHSLRADGTGEVYLALPAPPGEMLVAFNVEGFARLVAQGDARLVILSSCEGCSGLALSRMASRGVPAVAGFRWPVEDQDASLFTVALHRELRNAQGAVPVPMAFHRALVSLRDRTQGRLSAFSPVLVIQRSPWHDFSLGA